MATWLPNQLFVVLTRIIENIEYLREIQGYLQPTAELILEKALIQKKMLEKDVSFLTSKCKDDQYFEKVHNPMSRA